MDPEVAVITASPPPCAVTRPVELTMATWVLAELHATAVDRSWVLPSLNVPVAVSCLLSPVKRLRFEGLTLRKTRDGSEAPFEGALPPHPQIIRAMPSPAGNDAKASLKPAQQP